VFPLLHFTAVINTVVLYACVFIIIIHFIAVINTVILYARVFIMVTHFTSATNTAILYFRVFVTSHFHLLVSVQLQPLLGLHSTIKLVALPANVILEWRWLAVTNTLTYNAAKKNLWQWTPWWEIEKNRLKTEKYETLKKYLISWKNI
jgi:hypothetical protein